MARSKVFSLAEALAMGPPREGRLAIEVFDHGTLDLLVYDPPRPDPQQPHKKDEVYIVARGSAQFFDGDAHHAIEAGACVFVPAGEVHRFDDCSEDFLLWVIFYGPDGGEVPA